MLFSLGHGQHIIEAPVVRPASDGPALSESAAQSDGTVLTTLATTGASEVPSRSDAISIDAVLETGPELVTAAAVAVAPPAPSGGVFAYFFPYADPLPDGAALPGKLDSIAAAMIEQPADPVAQNSSIAPVFTYLGQFIDHDITANTDRDSSLSQIDGAITPVSRPAVTAGLFNLRDGSLRLDSIYGDTIGQGPFATKLAGLMRHPANNAKMRLGIPKDTPGQRPPFPAAGDDAADLLRLGFLLDRKLITQAELDALPVALRGTFVNADGTPQTSRAIIGDGRNDENLLVAQLHMSFLRFHNRLVDATGSFDKARKTMRWHYQWLVVNQYLKTVCDPAVVDDVVNRAAPLYADFFAAHGTPGSAQMPLPLEFSVAAFRFGHSMIRATYDHNRFFGEPVPGDQNLIPQADFHFLFEFTGNGNMSGAGGQLPRNWVIEWDRFVKADSTRPRRHARRIDTVIAPPLENMVNEAAGVFKHLAKRNLRRGYRLSLPTGQACAAALATNHHPEIVPLTNAELTSGVPGAALKTAGLADATPLWFYVLKEAEVRAGGQHLGPLGSVLVAETLVGLVVQDPASYWHGGAGGGRWSPADAGLPGGPVDSVEKLLHFARMM